MSLHLKYRPKDFKSIVGQDHIRITLQNAFKSGKLAHAYLFSGIRGTGKTSTARILAKSINCENPVADEPCNKCRLCIDINEGTLVDLIEIDAASNRGIDEIRDLKEKIKFLPSQAKAKIYIIDEVHMLTTEAFNALLKTLEEPPDHAFFILATTEIHKIPDTILSRCQTFLFNRIDAKDIFKRLLYIAEREKLGIEENALKLISGVCEGSLRDALQILEKMVARGELTEEEIKKELGYVGTQFLSEFYSLIVSGKVQKSTVMINSLSIEGYNLLQFNREFISFLRDKLLGCIKENKETKDILEIINIFTEAHEELKRTVIPQLPLEIAVVKVNDLIPKKEERKSFLSTVFGKKKEEDMTSSKEEDSVKKGDPNKLNQNKVEGMLPDFSLEEIQDKWHIVINQIETPFIKMSLRNSYPSELTEKNIVLKFKSKFHLEKVSTDKAVKQIGDAFEKVFGRDIAIKMEIGEIDLGSQPDSHKIETAEVKKKDLAEVAEDIFSGN